MHKSFKISNSHRNFINEHDFFLHYMQKNAKMKYTFLVYIHIHSLLEMGFQVSLRVFI